MKTEILFEDKLIAVCLKPAGIISQGSQSGEDMISILNGHFIQSGSDARAFPVHRLDRETAGLMVYAKNSAAAARLSKQAEQNEIKKRYFAILRGVPEEKSGVLKDLLFRDKQKNKSYAVNRMRKGVREASLEYDVICEKDGTALLDILLHTGRTHQIRVHLSSIHHPLLGDTVYGPAKVGIKHLQGQTLHAKTIGFNHPTTKEYVEFTAPLPEYFTELLESKL